MKKTIIVVLGFVVAVGYAVSYGEAPSGAEILERIDSNYRSKTRISTATMVITERRGARTVKSRSWGRGLDSALTQYLYPPREKDTKMLKLGDELWIWSPSTDRIIKISGHMLRQSMMGSDVSYEDFMEDPKLANTYDVKVSGEEKVNGRPCYVLALTAKKDKTPAYYSRNVWVDREHYLGLKEELYAKSGKLLKKITIDEIFKVGNRWYPKQITFKDMLRSGDGTRIIIEAIEFDVDIPDYMFTKASLKR